MGFPCSASRKSITLLLRDASRSVVTGDQLAACRRDARVNHQRAIIQLVFGCETGRLDVWMIRQERSRVKQTENSPDAASAEKEFDDTLLLLYFFLDVMSLYYFYDFKGQL